MLIFQKKLGQGEPIGWNPNDKAASVTLSNQNLTATIDGSGGYGNVRSSYSILTAEQKVWEITVGSTDLIIGTAIASVSLTTRIGTGTDNIGYNVATGQVWMSSLQGTLPTATIGDVIAIKFFTNKINWFKNGTQIGGNYPKPSGYPMFPIVGSGTSNGTEIATANFGTPVTVSVDAGFSTFS